jgi:hypothetical protein
MYNLLKNLALLLACPLEVVDTFEFLRNQALHSVHFLSHSLLLGLLQVQKAFTHLHALEVDLAARFLFLFSYLLVILHQGCWRLRFRLDNARMMLDALLDIIWYRKE